MQRLKEIIENFDQIELQDVEALKQYAHQHPYSAIVQLAYAYFLHKQENYNFNTQLKLTAAVINNRSKLFNIINGSIVAKVLKYHQAPVYVQDFEKIDDLRQEKIQNEKETNNTKNIFQNIQERSVRELENSPIEKKDKNLLNNLNTEDNPQIQKNISEEENEESTSVTHQHVQLFEINENNSANAEISESKEIVESNLKSEVQEKQTTNESNLEAIREKIRAKFGQQKSESIVESEKEKNITDNVKSDSESTNQIRSESSLSKEESKISLVENVNIKEENSQSSEEDKLKIKFAKDESDNEKLKEVKNRAANILLKLEFLKSKYGTVVSQSNEDKGKSDEISKPTEQEKSIYVTDENYPNTSENLEDEIQVEFDLTDTQVENSNAIQNNSTTTEFTHLVENQIEDDVNGDNTKENQNYIQRENDKYSPIDIDADTEIFDSTSTSKISLENENINTQEVKEKLLEKAIESTYDESSEEDDIFSKWLKTLHKTEEDSNKENNLKDRISPQKLSELNTNNNSNKKIEKLKIIDNFLSGNIQIKPKSPNTKSVEEHKDLSIKYTETTADLMTETLAELYIAQGHVDKAIQALEILKLKNPEKSSYFARRIQELKKKK
ncbi:hypothetical protein JCM31826_12650 [Thermaurantimonas aggregans]|uniref:Tetratricopeptide repeat protein n=1 Tax=Thermaurantimonas aggregans TaxID=2173829 RepID=A0A401XLA6_9FLAO|nr:hypothetical protein [Thermaurantimonas aggregans]MCX8148149.1 hypothetical protein [Thermaurantimonas aggregans]GCD77783.1 hypothetical protein JCM31826_12650 [Thermaurantimonas aggregans]